MGGRIVAGVIGFVVLVLLVQNYVLGDDDPGSESVGRTGAAATATLPAQTPEAISLGEVQQASTTGAEQSNGATGSSTYVVQSGDTLGTIATSFNVAPDAQAAWISEVLELNGIEDARLLQAGQELQVPAAPAAPDAAGGANGSTGAGSPIVTATPEPVDSGGDTYIVESGDTPLDIAAKFCVEAPAAWVNELVALNGIDSSNINIGDVLELPAATPSC